jgi:hypothetical protein
LVQVICVREHAGKPRAPIAKRTVPIVPPLALIAVEIG